MRNLIEIKNQRKSIGRELLKRWQNQEIELKNNQYTTNPPLMYFLKYWYNYYLKLCKAINKNPLSFGKWLLQDVD